MYAVVIMQTYEEKVEGIELIGVYAEKLEAYGAAYLALDAMTDDTEGWNISPTFDVEPESGNGIKLRFMDKPLVYTALVLAKD